MKRTLIISFAVMAAFVSCSKEFAENNTAPMSISFSAPETKTYMNYQGITRWSNKDQISVFANTGARCTFTAPNESGTALDFTCQNWPVGAVPEWAVFCYGSDQSSLFDVVKTEAGKFNALVSDYQKITQDDSFSSKSNVSVGRITEETGSYSGQMKNILGLVKITVPVENVSQVDLEDAAGTAPIAGQIAVDYTGETPTCAVIAGTGASRITAKRYSGSNQIAFTSGKAVYFCVIPGVEFTPKFTFTKTDGSKAVVTGNMAISVGRNKFVNLGTPSLAFVPEGYKAVVVDLNFANEAGTWPFTEDIRNNSQQKGSSRVFTYTEPNTGYTFEIAAGENPIEGQTAHGTYAFTSKTLRWYNTNDGTEYIKVNCPTGGQIAEIYLSTATASGNGNAYEITNVYTSETDKETVFNGTIAYKGSKTFDLTSTASAKYGCRIGMITSAKAYWISEIKVTYFVPAQ